MNWNLHLLRCFDKGSVAQSKGVPRDQCPYVPKPGSASTGVQLQRADYWRQGWDWQAKQEKKVGVSTTAEAHVYFSNLHPKPTP